MVFVVWVVFGNEQIVNVNNDHSALNVVMFDHRPDCKIDGRVSEASWNKMVEHFSNVWISPRIENSENGTTRVCALWHTVAVVHFHNFVSKIALHYQCEMQKCWGYNRLGAVITDIIGRRKVVV